MRRKRSLIAYLLCISLIITSLPTQIFATNKGNLQQQEIQYLKRMESLLTTSPGLQINEPAEYVGNNFKISFKIINKWDGAFNGEVILTNTGNKDIDNWGLNFNFPYEITNIWNAQITKHESDSYSIKNMGWNQDIQAGQSVTIGFQAKCTGEVTPPTAYKLISKEEAVNAGCYSAQLEVTQTWKEGYNGEVSIKNLSSTTIEDWRLEFDFEGEIQNFWTADILEHTGSHYIIKNRGYNANIAAGQSLILGFSGKGNIKQSTQGEHFILYAVNEVEQAEDIDYEKDSDHDDLPDYDEKELGTDPLNPDCDNDGIPDGYEYWTLMTDPLLADSDGNGISDADEDFDHDGLTNIEEYKLKTDPYDKDTDSDGLNDGDEVNKFKTNPLIVDKIDYELDSDSDGLADGIEMRLGTDPFNSDSDSDGLPDGYEVNTTGTDPVKADTDENGCNDSQEDLDQDGLTNIEEYQLGTDPLKADTDSDKLSDADEVHKYHTNPVVYDTDGDGIGDGDEVKIGLDPLNKCTKGIPDSEYSFEQNVSSEALEYINKENDDYKVSIKVEATGNAEDNVIVAQSQYANTISSNDAVMGKVINIDYAQGKIEKGELTFKIKDKLIDREIKTSESELQGLKRYYVFGYNTKINMPVPVDTDYDEANHEIKAKITGTGTYFIMDLQTWYTDIGVLSHGKDEPVNHLKRASRNVNAITAEKELCEIATSDDAVANMTFINDKAEKKKNNKVDLVFVVDTSAKMRGEIRPVGNGIQSISKALQAKALDVRFSIIDVKSINDPKVVNPIKVNGIPVEEAQGNGNVYFTTSTEKLKAITDAFEVSGGGDVNFSMLGTQYAGVSYATTLPFRQDACKFILLLTNSNSSAANKQGYVGINGILNKLNEQGIKFSVAAKPSDNLLDQILANYKKHTSKCGGCILSLGDFTRWSERFVDYVLSNLFQEKSFEVVGTNSLKRIELSNPLVKGGPTDTDGDGLTDSDEVIWEELDGNPWIKVTTDGYELPKLIDIWQTIAPIYGYEYNVEKLPYYDHMNQRVLPIRSDPTQKDSDNDGALDPDDELPFINDFVSSWKEFSVYGKDVYVGYTKYGIDNLRMVTFDQGTNNNQQVYKYVNEEWVLTQDDTITLSKDQIKAQIKDDKTVIDTISDNIVTNINAVTDKISEAWKSEDNSLREPTVLSPEDAHAEDAGIMCGIIDSILLNNGIKFPIYSSKGDVLFRFSIIPSNAEVKKAVLTLMGDSEYILEENMYYMRAKFYTEVIMMFVHGALGAKNFDKGSKLIAAGVISEGATCGAATLASGTAIVVGGALVITAVYQGALVLQIVKIATEDGAKLKGAGKTSTNCVKVNDKYLKKKGIDAHQLKKDYLGDKAPIAHYDIYVDKNTKELIIFKKGGQGMGISTGVFLE